MERRRGRGAEVRARAKCACVDCFGRELETEQSFLELSCSVQVARLECVHSHPAALLLFQLASKDAAEQETARLQEHITGYKEQLEKVPACHHTVTLAYSYFLTSGPLHWQLLCRHHAGTWCLPVHHAAPSTSYLETAFGSRFEACTMPWLRLCCVWLRLATWSVRLLLT